MSVRIPEHFTASIVGHQSARSEIEGDPYELPPGQFPGIDQAERKRRLNPTLLG